MRVIEGGFKRPIDPVFIKILRDLADRLERGENDTAVIGYIDAGEFKVGSTASPSDELMLATLVHGKAVKRLYEGAQ